MLAFNSGDQKRELEIVRVFADGKENSLSIGGKVDYESHPFQSFNLNGATSKIFGLVLVSCSPRNLLDGSSIDTWRALSAVNRLEYHHIFPKAFLESSGVSKKHVNAQANICLLSSGSNRDIWDSRPSVYFSRVKENLGDQLYDVLASNLISIEAYNACMREDYPAFVNERAKSISERMRELTCETEDNKREVLRDEIMTVITHTWSEKDDLTSSEEEDEENPED